MTIRRAGLDDAPAIQSLIRQVYDEYGFTWDPEGYHSDLYEEFEATYQEPNGAYWVAESQGRILGGGGIITSEPLPGEDGHLIPDADGLPQAANADCELVRLYLLPESRGTGVGFAITQEILNWARQQGLKKLQIWSDKKLTLAHPFYQRLGAKSIGERQCDDPDNSQEFGFLLVLP